MKNKIHTKLKRKKPFLENSTIILILIILTILSTILYQSMKHSNSSLSSIDKDTDIKNTTKHRKKNISKGWFDEFHKGFE